MLHTHTHQRLWHPPAPGSWQHAALQPREGRPEDQRYHTSFSWEPEGKLTKAKISRNTNLTCSSRNLQPLRAPALVQRLVGKSSPRSKQRSPASTPSPPSFSARFLVPLGQPLQREHSRSSLQHSQKGGERVVQGLDNSLFPCLGEDGPREVALLRQHKTHQLLRLLLKIICKVLEEREAATFILIAEDKRFTQAERRSSRKPSPGGLHTWSTAKRHGIRDPSFVSTQPGKKIKK